MAFEIGDVVILKGDRSNPMTVDAVSNSETYICVWLDNELHVIREEFQEKVLRKVS
jgi:uncharacterized protein YodC (DUF2158 family)